MSAPQNRGMARQGLKSSQKAVVNDVGLKVSA